MNDMTSPTVRSYFGDATAEGDGDTFEIAFNRLTVAPDRLVFVLTCVDGWGEFTAEHAAEKQSDGSYLAVGVQLRYTDYQLCETDPRAVIRLTVEAGNEACKVSGRWQQEGSIWLFTAALEPAQEVQASTGR